MEESDGGVIMTRSFLTILSVVAATGVLAAHHSHPDFLLDQSATITGEIERIEFKDPHVLITIRVADSTLFTAEWQGESWFRRRDLDYMRTTPKYRPKNYTPVTFGTLKIGDRVVIMGRPPRDPAVHQLVDLIEVFRPRDGWRWRTS
jgi:uncharacterized protein DUF6152